MQTRSVAALVAAALTGCPDAPPDPVSAGVASPVIEALEPAVGPATGGTRVRITGGALHRFARVSFGGAPALDVAVHDDGASLSCTTPRRPGGGAVDVTVTNPGGLADTRAAGFAYRPGPTIVRLDPTEGPQGGGSDVRAQVRDLQDGASLSATLGGKRLELTAVTADGFTFTTPAGRGLAELRVVGGDGQIAVLPEAFRYIPPARVRSVRPASGPVTGGAEVIVTGAGFRPGARLRFGFVDAGGVEVLSDTRMRATAPPTGAAGPVDVMVVDPDFGDGIALEAGFEYLPLPVLVGLAPAAGPERGGARVQVEGRGFLAGRTQLRFGAEIGVDSTYTIDGEGAGVIEVTTPPGRGAVDVVAVHDGVESAALIAAYTYVPPPTITAVEPTAGPTAGGQAVAVVGRAFQAGAVVVFGDQEAPEVAFDGPERLVTTTPPGPPGRARVRVRNPDGQTADLAAAYTYVPPPVVAAVTPGAGCESGGYEAVVVGRDLAPGVEIRFGDAPAEVLGVPAPRGVTVRVPAGVGVVAVTAVNPDGQEGRLAAAFAYDRLPRPVLLSPGIGPLDGGGELVVAGTCFDGVDGARLGDAAVDGLIVEDAGTLRGRAPAAAAEGVVDLVVTAGAQAGTLADAYFYNDGRIEEIADGDLEADGSTVAAVAADLDGDGFPDLALASAPAPDLRTDRIRVARPVGARMSVRWMEEAPLAASSVAAGDLDGDDLPELWFGIETGESPGSGRNRLYRNMGGYQFELLDPPPDDRLETTLAVAMADVDGDGDLDLLSGGFQGPRLHLNEGAGGFADAGERLGIDEDSPPIVLAMLAADLDGDDDVDLLLATHGAGVRLLRNDGRGIFRDATAERLPPGNPDRVAALAAGDLDGDGDLDLVLGGPGTDRLWLGEDGAYVDATEDRLPGADAVTTALALGDIDSDGDLDLVVGLGGALAIPDRVFDNDGQATFVDVTDEVLPGLPPTRTQCLVLEDFDGDGALDLYIGAAGRDILRFD